MKQFTDASIGLSDVNVVAINEAQNELFANSTLEAEKRDGLIGPTDSWVYRSIIQGMLQSGALKLTG